MLPRRQPLHQIHAVGLQHRMAALVQRVLCVVCCELWRRLDKEHTEEKGEFVSNLHVQVLQHFHYLVLQPGDLHAFGYLHWVPGVCAGGYRSATNQRCLLHWLRTYAPNNVCNINIAAANIAQQLPH